MWSSASWLVLCTARAFTGVSIRITVLHGAALLSHRRTCLLSTVNIFLLCHKVHADGEFYLFIFFLDDCTNYSFKAIIV